MVENKFDQGTTRLDKKLLERLIKETTLTTDRNGVGFLYWFPLKEDFTDVCQYVLSKHGIGMEKYKSGLNPFPILRFPYKDIDKLSDSAREFLFSVNVKPEELEKHWGKIVQEMKANKR